MKKPKKICCVKKPYELEEMKAEVDKLRLSDPGLIWSYYECPVLCQGWHVLRTYPPGYQSEEKKKAIALWLAKKRGQNEQTV